MLNNKRIIVYSGLNSIDQNWLKQRISVFMKYTLQCLKIQTNQNFLAFITFRPDTKEIIEMELSKYKKLPDNIKFISSNTFNKLILKNINGYEYFYLVRLDSDDMYHKSFIQQLHDYTPKDDTQILICQKGYIYDSLANRLAKYFHLSPQFYTLIYKVKNYQQAKRHDLGGSHMGAINLNHEILEEPNYINHVHSGNTAFLFPKSDQMLDIDVWDDNKKIHHMFPQLVGNEIEDKNMIKKILADFIGPSLE
ncbi:glycosyltransferase [Brassicibacter mesophilus]|uniref:glycosyltransferase n=1 Tax=Brassicibacter mesophilus TaxID=745119 RepID=UPI003D1D2C88